MIELTLPEVSQALNTEHQGNACDLLFLPPVSIDSRTLRAGECFIAIRGKQFDGHNFIPEALAQGARVVIYSEDCIDPSKWKDRLFLRVEDTIEALQKLAKTARCQWGKPLLAISGSMGKTTTREFTASLLSERFSVFQSPRNLNNEIGVPLSLLQLRSEDELAVLELGMNHPGEIRSLAKICLPNAALLTNVAAVHLEFFSDVDQIAAAKGEILEGLMPNGKFFYNADDPRLRRLARDFKGHKISFALNQPADVQIVDYRLEGLQKTNFEIALSEERIRSTVPFTGTHFLYNVAAAVAAAANFGLTSEELRKGLEKLTLPPMRGQIHRITDGSGGSITVWDDSYNSNPEALARMLETAGQIDSFSRKILALGEMLELGPSSSRLHYQIGQCIARCSPDLLVTVGNDARHLARGARAAGLPAKQTHHFETSDQAGEFFKHALRSGDLLLVKGSRGVQMERIIQIIRGEAT